MLKETVHSFLVKECPREYVRYCDDNEHYPHELFDKVGAMGWFGACFPERYGGSGGDTITLAIMQEEFGYFFFTFASACYHSTVMMGMSIYRCGSEEQRQRYLPLVCQGKLKFSLGLTEPEAGSDAANIQTIAVAEGDTFVINGTKTFTTAIDVADYVLLVTRTDKSLPKHQGITLFLADPKTPGISYHPIKKIALKAAPFFFVTLDNIRVPRENMLGGLNEGWANLGKTLEIGRISVAARCVGGAQACVDDAIEHAKSRVQFGQPIGKFQAIRHMIAEMQMNTDAARLLLYRAAWMVKEGRRAVKECAMAKTFAAETYMRNANNGVQILGGYGLTLEYDMQRHFRDAKTYEVGQGSNQIQREIIARELGL